MAPRNPRTRLATHDVANQPPPLEDVNLFSSDEILRSAVQWSGAGSHMARLTKFGAQVGSAETQAWAAQANRVAPSLSRTTATAAASMKSSFIPPITA